MSLKSENKRRDKYLRKKYSISLKDYNKMLKKQNNCCAICKKHKSKFARSLAVDHDHSTGEIRGLLCFWCNKRFVGRHTKLSVLKLLTYFWPTARVIVE